MSLKVFLKETNMKITALVENQTHGECRASHGLSLYIETEKHKLLFDLGSDDTLFVNAQKMEIDLAAVDTVIISHGHFDHGGALEQFLKVNPRAKVYVQRKAFDPHFSKVLFLKANIGLDVKLAGQEQIVAVDGDYVIDDELRLFTVDRTDRCYSGANDALYAKEGKDRFEHEQNLIVSEKENVLIMGCGHTGIVNILDKAKAYSPQVCIGGYHLFNPMTKKTVPEALLSEIAAEMKKYPGMKFYTCHCTGAVAYRYLAEKVPELKYLSCGESLEC